MFSLVIAFNGSGSQRYELEQDAIVRGVSGYVYGSALTELTIGTNPGFSDAQAVGAATGIYKNIILFSAQNVVGVLNFIPLDHPLLRGESVYFTATDSAIITVQMEPVAELDHVV